jgi:hypothetical protein
MQINGMHAESEAAPHVVLKPEIWNMKVNVWNEISEFEFNFQFWHYWIGNTVSFYLDFENSYELLPW